MTTATEINRLVKQTDTILDYMRLKGSITPAEALRDCSCMRLAARIYDLTKQGYRIKREIEQVKNKEGEFCRVARYSLEQEPRQLQMFT